jgi:hypothetical protein
MKTKNLLLISLALGLGLAAAAVLALSQTPTAQAAGPWYVSPSGDDTDCLSWGTACTTINGAIAKASSGDTIHVGAGTYVESPSFDNITLTLTGAGADTTFIDGGGGNRVVYVGSNAVHHWRHDSKRAVHEWQRRWRLCLWWEQADAGPKRGL